MNLHQPYRVTIMAHLSSRPTVVSEFLRGPEREQRSSIVARQRATAIAAISLPLVLAEPFDRLSSEGLLPKLGVRSKLTSSRWCSSIDRWGVELLVCASVGQMRDLGRDSYGILSRLSSVG
jgi:hypothetical protein